MATGQFWGPCWGGPDHPFSLREEMELGRRRNRQLLTGTWDAGDSRVTEVGGQRTGGDGLAWMLGEGAGACPEVEEVLAPAPCAFDIAAQPPLRSPHWSSKGLAWGLLGLACVYSGCLAAVGDTQEEGPH